MDISRYGPVEIFVECSTKDYHVALDGKALERRCTWSAKARRGDLRSQRMAKDEMNDHINKRGHIVTVKIPFEEA